MTKLVCGDMFMVLCCYEICYDICYAMANLTIKTIEMTLYTLLSYASEMEYTSRPCVVFEPMGPEGE